MWPHFLSFFFYALTKNKGRRKRGRKIIFRPFSACTTFFLCPFPYVRSLGHCSECISESVHISLSPLYHIRLNYPILSYGYHISCLSIARSYGGESDEEEETFVSFVLESCFVRVHMSTVWFGMGHVQTIRMNVPYTQMTNLCCLRESS